MVQYIKIITFASLFSLVAGSNCNADNCLRAFRATQTPGRLQYVQSLCATFTKAPTMVISAVPSFAALACTGDVVARVSSACSCIPERGSAITQSKTSGSSTFFTSDVSKSISRSSSTYSLSTISTSTSSRTTTSTSSPCAIVSSLVAVKLSIHSTGKHYYNLSQIFPFQD